MPTFSGLVEVSPDLIQQTISQLIAHILRQRESDDECALTKLRIRYHSSWIYRLMWFGWKECRQPVQFKNNREFFVHLKAHDLVDQKALFWYSSYQETRLAALKDIALLCEQAYGTVSRMYLTEHHLKAIKYNV